jgi:hypothetical protein
MAKKNTPKSSPLAAITASELRRELAVREKRIQQLHNLKQKLAARMAELDRQLAAEGMASGDGIRPRNETTLVSALKTVLKDKPLTVTEAAEAVQRSGYVSSSPNFRIIVNAALINKKNFTRVDRGVYAAK